MSLIPGSFNADIPGYQIKFDEKYGEEENLLKNVLIYDLRGGRGNQKVITAEKGKVLSESIRSNCCLLEITLVFTVVFLAILLTIPSVEILFFSNIIQKFFQ